MPNFKDIRKYTKDLNILYVEDDPGMLESTHSMLENFFYSVQTAVNGLDGLNKFISYKDKTSKFYDLIITDINMPQKNGLEMIKDIKAINKNQYIIVISAYNDSQRLIELIREGISNFITKPIIPDQLMKIIFQAGQNIQTQKIQDEFMITQSKLASMGEMIDTIAHQWQSPITLIKMQTQMLELELDDGTIKQEDIRECISKQTLQINHILETLNEFRLFFRPSTKLLHISCQELIDSTILLLKDKLLKSTVDININIEKDIEIEVIPNEFKHVLISIIDNSIDEFTRATQLTPNITINSYQKDGYYFLEIVDNAGGVPIELLDKIFEANFTTKENELGTGMGLYLVSLILQKINAKITVENVEDGAKFTIMLKNNLI